jgi:hypothetical protein
MKSQKQFLKGLMSADRAAPHDIEFVGFDTAAADTRRVYVNPAHVASVCDDLFAPGTAIVTLTGEGEVTVRGNSDTVAWALNEAIRAARRAGRGRHRSAPANAGSLASTEQGRQTRALRASTVTAVAATVAARRARLAEESGGPAAEATLGRFDAQGKQDALDQWEGEGGGSAAAQTAGPAVNA